MKAIFLIFLFIGSVLSVKENSLKQNKVEFASVCDECQQVVKRFTNAAKDPSKMSIMKDSLSTLCEETEYEEECQVFVDKLDSFATYLSPYLQNSHGMCMQFNMCSNSRISPFQRVGLLFAKRFLNKIDGTNDLTCEECQFSAHELLEVIDDQIMQAQIHNVVSENVCAHLGEYKGTCKVVTETFLPNLFNELHNMLSNDKQFCVDLKLCSSQQVNLHHRLTANDMKSKLMGPKYVQNLLKKIQNLKANDTLPMSCMECEILADIVLDELKTDNMISTLAGLLQFGLCLILPEEFGCNDFVSIYGTTVVYMTVEQFDSESVCTALKSCTNDSITQMAKYTKAEKLALRPMKCSGCNQLSDFLRAEMMKPKARSEITYGLQHLVCQEAPKSLHNICENFFGGLLPTAYDKFLHLLQDNMICQKIQAC